MPFARSGEPIAREPSCAHVRAADLQEVMAAVMDERFRDFGGKRTLQRPKPEFLPPIGGKRAPEVQSCYNSERSRVTTRSVSDRPAVGVQD
jgi:hypothetical protein